MKEIHNKQYNGITLKLSQSLLSILQDAGIAHKETWPMEVENGTTVRQVLMDQRINPLLVPMIFQDNKKISLDTPIESDAVLILHGPLAGG
ncbi:MAG: MoaD/ThiS family protein [Desulfamplus sp.]|nr:MoaD/ThiS family protein [Desulfamplus sp.]